MADVLLSTLSRPEEQFLTFVRSLSGSSTVGFNRRVAQSEQSCGYLNAAIANLLKYHGNIRGDITRVLEFYFLMCSVEMSCHELARLPALCQPSATIQLWRRVAHLVAGETHKCHHADLRIL